MTIDAVKGHKGFTMIELLIVVAVLGIIAAIVAPNMMGFFSGFATKADQNTARLFASELEKEFMLGKVTLTSEGTVSIKHTSPSGYTGIIPKAQSKPYQYLRADISKEGSQYKITVYYDDLTTNPLYSQLVSGPIL